MCNETRILTNEETDLEIAKLEAVVEDETEDSFDAHLLRTLKAQRENFQGKRIGAKPVKINVSPRNIMITDHNDRMFMLPPAQWSWQSDGEIDDLSGTFTISQRAIEIHDGGPEIIRLERYDYQ